MIHIVLWYSRYQSVTPHLSYKDAGVNIEAGNSLVKDIHPLAKETKRPGCDASLGGFGALFDIKAAGFRDPILVSGTDGVGTKLKVRRGRGNKLTPNSVWFCEKITLIELDLVDSSIQQ
jgi:hypothetical protein